MNPRRTHCDNAAIEDCLAVILDLILEDSLHAHYQAAALASPEINLAELLTEQAQHNRYQTARLRTAMQILLEARPSPYAYNPNRPAVRPARPLYLERTTS